MNNQLGSTNERLAIGTSYKNVSDVNYVTSVGQVHGSAKEVYYCWLARFVAFIAILSLMFFTSASLVLFKLAPEVHVEPFLIIRQDNSDEMVRYETISTKMPSAKQMMELFIRQYVILRHTVIDDEREMQSRWFGGGMINYLSSDKVFDEFERGVYVKPMKRVEAQLQELSKDKTSRSVEIISVNKVGGDKSPIWKVDFKTYELSPMVRNLTTNELVLKTQYWTASIVAVFVPDRMFMSKRLMNPLGFTVTKYSQTEVEIL